MSSTFPGVENRGQARRKKNAPRQGNIGVVIAKVMRTQSDKSLQKLHHFSGSAPKRPSVLSWRWKHSVGVFRERCLTEWKGFVCRHRLIIKSIAMVRANIAYCWKLSFIGFLVFFLFAFFLQCFRGYFFYALLGIFTFSHDLLLVWIWFWKKKLIVGSKINRL